MFQIPQIGVDFYIFVCLVVAIEVAKDNLVSTHFGACGWTTEEMALTITVADDDTFDEDTPLTLKLATMI
jgi:hypothetical protein